MLVVAEKPSVARDIARVLGCRQREGAAYRGDGVAVTWAIGHLVTLCEPDEVDPRYKKWRMEDLPILPNPIPTRVIPRTRAQFEAVRRLMCARETERIVCATDAGREGELIFRLIYEKSGCSKPVDRLWISSMTDAAIREGFAALQPSERYDGLYLSALCRAQADWLVGMNASRAFSLRHGPLLSVGRVQTPTLALLAAREAEIRAFVPQEYHTVTAGFGDYTGLWFDPENPDERENARLKDRKQAEAVAAAVLHEKAVVTQLSAEHKKEAPPLLYDLTSLQRDTNRLHGFTAARTLKAAQKLYEIHKCITYPRTDSRFLPPDMYVRVQKTLESLDAAYQPRVQGIVRPQGKLPFSPRIFNAARVTDHHAILPTPRTVDPQGLGPDERAVYDLIARRLIAAFYPAYEYEAVRAVTLAAGHSFRSFGRRVIEAGWTSVLGQPDEKTEALPDLKTGEERTVLSARVKKETTRPPAPHTDASLLGAMERAGREAEDEELRERMKGSGIGTPATRAAIIERLVTVGYAQRRGRTLRATEKGERLIAAVPPEIASAEMTGKWELALDRIARGAGDPARFMDGIHRFAAFLVDFAKEQPPGEGFGPDAARASRGRARRPAGLACPLCGEPVLENSRAFGCTAWKQGCGFTLWKNAFEKEGGPVLTEELVRPLLAESAVSGEWGLLRMEGERVDFIPAGREAPARSVPIRGEKGGKRETPRRKPARGSR